MSPAVFVILFFATGVALLVAELLLPTHGVLGILGVCSFVAAIGACFFINQYAGLLVFILAIVATPFVSTYVMNLWPHTPIGRRLVLRHVETPPPAPALSVGQIGIAVGQLKPMGHCDFGELRVQSISEHGVIDSGSQVKIVAINSGIPTVRPAATTSAS